MFGLDIVEVHDYVARYVIETHAKGFPLYKTDLYSEVRSLWPGFSKRHFIRIFHSVVYGADTGRFSSWRKCT